jgi:hypothetical protein
MAKTTIVLNSSEKLTAILQESYDLANAQIKNANDEISKLATSTILKDITMDEKAKYYKAMNDLLVIKDKAIGRKLDICKVLQDVIEFNGDVSKAINGEHSQNASSIDFTAIRDAIDNGGNDGSKKEVYNIT